MSLASAKNAIDDGAPISKADHQASYDELINDTALTGATTAETVAVTGSLSAGSLAGGLLPSAAPAGNGTAAAGTATVPARADHVHPSDPTQIPHDAFRLRPLSGQYVSTKGTYAQSDTTLGVSRLHYTPIVLDAGTLDRIGAEVTIATAGTVLRLGLYTHNLTTGRPNALVIDAGTIDGNTVGVQSITISQSITAAVYWLGVASQGGSPVCRSIGVSGVPRGLMTPASSATSAVYGSTWLPCLFESSVTGALPATASTSLSGRAGSSSPLAFVRYA